MKSRLILAAAVISLCTFGGVQADIIVPDSGSTTDPIAFGSIDNVIDGTLDVDSFLGMGVAGTGTFTGPYTVTFDLGGSFELDEFNLWNNAGVNQNDGEGVNAFTLRFLNADAAEISTFDANANDGLAQQSFAISATNVAFVDFVITSNHGVSPERRYADFYELNFDGTAVPEPSSVAIVGSCLLGVVVARRRRRTQRQRRLRSKASTN